MAQQKNQPPVIIFNDFVCPYSYIAQEQTDRLERDYAIEANWRPHWLTRDVPPEGRPIGDKVDHARRAAQAEWLKEMAPEKADKIRHPNFTPYTFRAFEALEYARENGKASPFRSAAFDAMWLDGKDIGKIEVLQELAEKVGLDPNRLGRALKEGRYTEKTLHMV